MHFFAESASAGDTMLTQDAVAIDADGKTITDITASIRINAVGTYKHKCMHQGNATHFPTVVLPVAAIIGVVFTVSGKRKDE